MAFWILDQWDDGPLDYPTLGFVADPDDILEAAAAPDGRWSSTGAGPETVTRYTLGVDPSYVEPGDGHVLTWSDVDNTYVPTAADVFLGEGLDAVTANLLANPASDTFAASDAATATQIGDPGSEVATAFATEASDVDSTIGAALAKRYQTQTMNLRAEVTPSGVNDTASVNTALATFAAAGGGRLVIPRGDWTFTGATGLTLTGTANPIHIEAEPGTVFDMTGSTATTGLTLGGALGTSAALGADAARYDMTITCGLAVAAGDLLRITSTALFDTIVGQGKGEIVEVASSAAGIITLKSALFDSYTAATSTVTKMTAPRVGVEELTILRNSDHAAMVIAYAREVLLGGLYAEGARERLHYLNGVYHAVVDSCGGRDFYSASTGTSYGLAVGASQHVTEIGLFYKGGRHAISHGGSYPSRDIQVLGGTLDNNHASGLQAIDFHANVEGVVMRGVTSLNRLVSQASNFDAEGCTVIGIDGRAVELYAPRDCDYVKFRGTVRSRSTNDGVGWVPRSAVAAAHRVRHVEIGGDIITTDGTPITVGPATSSDANSTITRLDVRGYLHSTGSGGTGAAMTILKSGAATVTIDETEIDGRLRTESGNGLVTQHTGTSIRLRGKVSTGKAAGYPISIGAGVTDVFLDDGFVTEGTNGPYRSEFNGTGKLHARHLTVVGGSSSAGFYAPNYSEVLLDDCTFPAGTTPTVPAYTITGRTQSGNATIWGTAAPTSGTWKRGDVCWNSAPIAGGTIGWVCTTAGTPGTWGNFGQAAPALSSTTNLTNVAQAINTTDKYQGKRVWNVNTHKTVVANGPLATDVWYDEAGAIAHTPV